MAATAAGDLLERDSELARVRDLLDEARGRRGRLLMVEGPAGIGKTRLLEAASRMASREGFGVLGARGGQLERDFPYGVVRQLFEAELHQRSPEDRASLLGGAAALAAPIVAADPASLGSASSADPAFAVAHGLYWLTANLSDQRPLFLAVDDAHWSDPASLRFLAHLARRIDGMPVLLAVAVRTREPGSEQALLTELSSQREAQFLEPKPLSDRAIARLIADRLGERADPEFANACQRATGGTPFLVTELLAALRERKVPPRRDAVEDLGRIGTETVARATLLRLTRVGPAATELARAVAILGGDAQLHRAAGLAHIGREDAIETADTLVAMHILEPGRPLEFVHPLVRSAVYEDIPRAARAAAHSRAAELLAEERADLDAIATHLLFTEPEGRAATVERLREAARRAMGRGAPESASTYLNRALREGAISPEEEATLLFELAKARRRVQPEVAAEHMRRAHRLAANPVQRAEIAYELADTLLYAGWDESIAVAQSALAEAAGLDGELVIRLETLRAIELHLRRIDDFVARVPRLKRLAGADTPAQRLMALYLAGALAWFRQPPDEVLRLLDIGLEGNRLLEDEGPESSVLAQVFNALIATEALDRALRLANELVADAQRRGSIVGFGYAAAVRAWVEVRRGDLRAAAADVHTALEALPAHALTIVEAGTLSYLVDAFVEVPEIQGDADRLLARLTRTVTETTASWPMLLDARGRIRLARGEVGAGTEDLERCNAIRDAHGNPNVWWWRPALALALAQTNRERALELAERNLKAAHEVGLPRGIGIGLRTLGLVEGGARGLDLLEQAVSVLEGSPARLEYARALVELGAARRRANQRAAAREPLRLGLELAHRCGATRLAERAREELAATGARPRREMITGRDALTATEQRIASMAAEGMSNPEIAQALFVTRKTVENHLARVYAKLGIHSRERLADALAEPAT